MIDGVASEHQRVGLHASPRLRRDAAVVRQRRVELRCVQRDAARTARAVGQVIGPAERIGKPGTFGDRRILDDAFVDDEGTVIVVDYASPRRIPDR